MATRRLSIGPNERVEDIVEAAGAATATKSIELTFDHQTAVKAVGNPRQTLDKAELLSALTKFEDYIIKLPLWPPS